MLSRHKREKSQNVSCLSNCRTIADAAADIKICIVKTVDCVIVHNNRTLSVIRLLRQDKSEIAVCRWNHMRRFLQRNRIINMVFVFGKCLMNWAAAAGIIYTVGYISQPSKSSEGKLNVENLFNITKQHCGYTVCHCQEHQLHNSFWIKWCYAQCQKRHF